MQVRTRMAPSPTGEYHIGHIRTLLYNYAWAKKNHGRFILRIEDTDRERYVEGSVGKILEVIKNYGLDWDEGPGAGGRYGPYIQSARLEIYQKYAHNLIADKKAYYCFCSKERLEKLREFQIEKGQKPGYDRLCRNLSPEEVKKKQEGENSAVIRFKIPDNELISYHDFVMGDAKINSSEIDDQILLKSDGFPTYHLAVVVDDHLMKITHILRGSEWISSTPKHFLLYRAFGWKMPEIGHLPVFLDISGKGKMSKRIGSSSARSFLENGYLPEAILNYLMLLGWNPGTRQEIFSLGEFIQAFSLEGLNKSNPKFDLERLNWFNTYYLRHLEDKVLAQRIVNFTNRKIKEIKKVLPLVKDRLVTLKDFDNFTNFFFEKPKMSLENFSKIKVDRKQILEHALGILAKSFDGKILETAARKFCAENKIKVGDYFMILRLAVTGQTATPPLWEVMKILGQEETLLRLS